MTMPDTPHPPLATPPAEDAPPPAPSLSAAPPLAPIAAEPELDAIDLPHQTLDAGNSCMPTALLATRRARFPAALPPVVVTSVSLGSSKRNSRAETTLLGRRVILSRIGVDGDRARARTLFESLDGKVDAFGFGGADAGVTVDGRFYAFSSLAALTAGLQTPVVDGGGLRSVIERRIAQQLPPELAALEPKRALITTAVDRYDMLRSFADAGFDCLCGDLGFVFGIPFAIRSVSGLHRLARVLLPVVRRLPFEMLYPTGKKQEESHLRFPLWFNWATFICGDFLFLRTHLPERLDGKVIVTNTTTSADVELLRERGARALVTSTPRIDGRSFGTNVIEAALTAIAGKGRALTPAELSDLVGDALPPTVTLLTP